MRRDAERLSDVVEAADKIAARVERGRQNFDVNEDTQIVLVHLIQVIGEAASGLSDESPLSIPRYPGARLLLSAIGLCTATLKLISTSSGMWR